MSDKTKIIASTATTAWKGSRTVDDTIKLLSEVEGISADESKDIVNQVFDNKIDVKAGDSDIDQLEQWIRQNMDIQLNEVTNKHEINGVVLEDKDYNSFFWMQKNHSQSSIILCLKKCLIAIGFLSIIQLKHGYQTMIKKNIKECNHY